MSDLTYEDYQDETDRDPHWRRGTLRFRVLGPPRIECGGDQPGGVDNETHHISGRRQKTILSLLLVHVGRYVSIDRLIDGIWCDDTPPATCRKQVQNATAALSRSIRRFACTASAGDGAALVTGPYGYCLRARRDEVDALAFEDIVRLAVQDRMRALNSQDIAKTLRAALQTWTGDPFAELTSRELRSEAVRLEELRLLAIEELADLDLRLGGEPAIHVAELSALTQRYPTRERLWLLLMEALQRSGRAADALDRYRRYRTMLIDHHGIEPGQLIKAKERQILLHCE